MRKIASFTVDHLRLESGLYLSRRDEKDGAVASTFDLRFTAPNRAPATDMPALHTIEHLGATFLRNSSRADEIVYFGPMGCRTGFYLILFGDRSPEDALPLIGEMCSFILSYEGEIPGARPEECGNYLEQNLAMAKYYTARYARMLEETPRLRYPD